MRRSVGLAIGAVVLSVTVGVLVGLVIHAGMTQRAGDAATTPPPTLASSQSAPGALREPSSVVGSSLESSDAGSSGSAGPWLASLTPVTDASGDVPTSSAVPAGTSSTPAATPSTTASSPSRSVSRSTPATSGHVTTSNRVIVTTATASGTAGTTDTAAPGRDGPGGRCGTLGEKSSTPDGATLFCQHDQTDGRLRWRAVTNGGGCLNQTMTGTGVDGEAYACRRDANGLNYWRPAH